MSHGTFSQPGRDNTSGGRGVTGWEPLAAPNGRLTPVPRVTRIARSHGRWRRDEMEDLLVHYFGKGDHTGTYTYPAGPQAMAFRGRSWWVMLVLG